MVYNNHNSQPTGVDDNSKPIGICISGRLEDNLGQGYYDYPHPEAFSSIITEENQSNRENKAELRAKDVKLAFIRKVYIVVTIQLLVAFILVLPSTMHRGLSRWIRGNPAFLYVATTASVISFVPLVCCKSARKNFIGILVSLTVITLCTGTLIAVISAVYNTKAVLLGAGISAIICLALSVLSSKTKLDFTRMVVGLIVVILVCSITVGCILMYLRSSFPILHICYAAIGSFIFSTSLVCTTARFAPNPGQVIAVNL